MLFVRDTPSEHNTNFGKQSLSLFPQKLKTKNDTYKMVWWKPEKWSSVVPTTCNFVCTTGFDHFIKSWFSSTNEKANVVEL